jgi:hypothetical protein
MLEVSKKVSGLADEQFWEIKTQSHEFATTILNQYRSHSHLMAVKDDLKLGGGTGVSCLYF